MRGAARSLKSRTVEGGRRFLQSVFAQGFEARQPVLSEWRKVKCSFMQLLSNLGFRRYLFTSIKKKQLPAIFSPVPSSLASSHLLQSFFLLLTCSFSPPRNAELRCCTGAAASRRERSFLQTLLHAVRTRNTLPRTRARILLSLHTRIVPDTCSQGHHERRWRTIELKRKQQSLQILA